MTMEILLLFQWTVRWSIYWLISLLAGCLGCIIMAFSLIGILGMHDGFMILNTLIKDEHHYLLFTHLFFLDIVMEFLVRILSLISNNWSISIAYWVKVGILGIKLWILRFYLLSHWSILFLFFGAVGGWDGFIQRRLRGMAAGRDSAFIYHYAQTIAKISFVLSIIVTLMFPFSIAKNQWIFIVALGIWAFFLQMSIKNFKKYF